MGVYSHSRLGTYENCPLQYKLRYIDRVKPDFENTIEAFMGSMCHDTLEEVYRQTEKGTVPTLADVLKDYNTRWSKKYSDSIHIVRKQFNSEYYRLKGEQFLEAYYHRFAPFDQDETLGLETTDLVPLDSRHKIHVRIDRLAKKGDMYEVHDYKTAASLPTQDKVDSDRQLGVYAFGVRKLYPNVPIKKITLIWHYLAHDKDLVSTRTDEDLEILRQKIILLIEEIENCKDFSPKTSRLCDWCGYRSKCPHYKHLYEITATESLQNFMPNAGIELVDKYVQVHQEIKEKTEKLDELKKKLLSFAKMEKVKSVFGSDKKISVVSGEQMGFPGKNDPQRAKFEEILKQIGLWEKLETLDTHALIKMISEEEVHPELVKVLEPFMKKDERSSLRIGKK